MCRSSRPPSPKVRWTCGLTGEHGIGEEPQTGRQKPSPTTDLRGLMCPRV